MAGQKDGKKAAGLRALPWQARTRGRLVCGRDAGGRGRGRLPGKGSGQAIAPEETAGALETLALLAERGGAGECILRLERWQESCAGEGDGQA